MAATLHNGTNAELYSRLLWGPAEGLALFHPGEECDVLDCGYISNGTFTRLFNARDPPRGIKPFVCASGLDTTVSANSGTLEVTETRSFTLTTNLSAVPLLASMQSAEITPEITRSSKNHAFLQFLGTQRTVERLKIPDINLVDMWLFSNYAQLLARYGKPDLQVITSTVKSAGWRGGVGHRQSSTTGGGSIARFWGIILASIGCLRASDTDSGLVLTGSPPESPGDAPRNYTIVVNYTQIKILTQLLYKLRRAGRMFIGDASAGKTASQSEVSTIGEQAHDSDEDPGIDRTVLTEIMRREGYAARDDEVIIVMSSRGVIDNYRKAVPNAELEPETIGYHVKRMEADEDGGLAARVVIVHEPEAATTPASAIPWPLNLMDQHDREYPPETVSIADLLLKIWTAAIVGMGGHGAVFAGTLGEQRVAVKVLDLSGTSTKDAEIKKHINIWSSLSHPRILPFLGECKVGFKRVGLLSPYMENGTLMDFTSKYPTEDRLQLLKQVAEGVDYLHTKAGVVHGDLKGSNILVSENRTALLSSFDLSTIIMTSTPPATPIRRFLTLSFAAPELFTDSAFEAASDTGDSSKRSKTTHSDIYAFGMLIYQVITAAPPWKGMLADNVRANVVKGRRPSRTWQFDDELWKLCEACWTQDPFVRPNISTVLAEMTHLANAAH